MRRLLPKIVLAPTVAFGAALPALAHVTVSATAHLHASDVAGLAVVVALTVAAGWIDRRLQRARRREHEAAARQRRATETTRPVDPRDRTR